MRVFHECACIRIHVRTGNNMLFITYLYPFSFSLFPSYIQNGEDEMSSSSSVDEEVSSHKGKDSSISYMRKKLSCDCLHPYFTLILPNEYRTGVTVFQRSLKSTYYYAFSYFYTAFSIYYLDLDLE